MRLSNCRLFAIRQLAVYSLGAILVCIFLTRVVAQGNHSRSESAPIAPADTDSVSLYQVDSLRALLLRLGRDYVRNLVLNLQPDSILLARREST